MLTDLVALDGGRYRMGSTQFYPEEAPVHTVAVAPFAIERHPVTNAQFADSRYIVTAWGRDFRDVSPLKGVVYTESKKSTLEVKVDVFRVNPDGTLS